ncbi:MAG: hydroxymethylglutaryl-CoA lyase [Planctomycetota bacterium]
MPLKSGLPRRVRVVEVGPRDGLQNQPEAIAAADKIGWIERLAAAGLEEIEGTAFVHPKWVPQLADAAEVGAKLPELVARPSALVPNRAGLDRALDAGLNRIALFTAASETFCQKNTNCSIDESLDRFAEVFAAIADRGTRTWVRGYVSTCFGCPYEGDVAVDTVVRVTEQLLQLGVDEIAISDTIGTATPAQVERVIERTASVAALEQLALHFHDTRGLALVNVWAGLRLGVTTFDAAAGGLGGCPYAPGASGNLATEDLIYFLDSLGIDTGVDLQKLVAATLWFEQRCNATFPGRVLASQRPAQ